MSNKKYPRVLSLIAAMGDNNEELRELFEKLDNVLQENENQQQSSQKLQQDMQNLRVELLMLRRANSIAQAQREENKACEKIIMSLFENVSEMFNLLSHDMFTNIMHNAALRKQNEVQEELKRIQEMQTLKMEHNTMMENRSIVKKFRESQRLLQEAEKEHQAVKLEGQELDRQWTVKIDRARELRNKKIVSLVLIRKEIAEMLTIETADDNRSSMPKRGRSENCPSRLLDKPDLPRVKSPLDFLNNISKVKINITDQPPRSILAQNRSQEDPNQIERIPSPTKQVSFAPLPPPINMTDSMDSEIQNAKELVAKMKQLFGGIDPFLSDNIPELSSELPQRAVVQKVELLPPLELSTIKDIVPDTDEFDWKRPMAEHSFENIFGNENSQGQDNIGKDTDFPFSQMSMEVDSESANDGFPSTSSRRTRASPDDDYFSSFFNENSTDINLNDRSYDL